jgi:hypothetical protein
VQPLKNVVAMLVITATIAIFKPVKTVANVRAPEEMLFVLEKYVCVNEVTLVNRVAISIQT